MITGSITLNNLTEQQFNYISEAHEQNSAVLSFDPTKAQRSEVGRPTALFSQVTFSWNNEAGMKAALQVSEQLINLAPAVSASA